MVRKIIEIDENKCNGCGICVEACHEGAIGMVDGKAKLMRDDYCDGLGDCLPTCPTGAITFVEREALEYNETEVKANMAKKAAESKVTGSLQNKAHFGCPGSNARTIEKKSVTEYTPVRENTSQLNQWPVQIKLVPVNAPYFDGANLLISADCAAYAYANFHSEFMRNKITIIGCPKLDNCDYSDKLTEIIRENDIKSVTVVRMEVPCCAGIENAVKNALIKSGKMIPWQVVTIGIDGTISP